MSTVLDLSHRHASELRECADDAERARITELNLACNYIDVAGLSRGLASFTHVRVLSCCANNLTELPDISVLPLLEELDVANNYITSLARLAQAGAASSRLRLRRLDIRQNYIDSLAGIEQCRELQWCGCGAHVLRRADGARQQAVDLEQPAARRRARARAAARARDAARVRRAL
jgi:hypothetical protein